MTNVQLNLHLLNIFCGVSANTKINYHLKRICKGKMVVIENGPCQELSDMLK